MVNNYIELRERDWSFLIDSIKTGRVVPILGQRIFSISNNLPNLNVVHYLLQELSKKFSPNGIIASDIAEIEDYIIENNYLSRRYEFPTNIYYEINQILRETVFSCEEGISYLAREGVFPLILTTTYLPGIDKLLGINQGNVYIYKKSSSSDIPSNISETDGSLLYYLFGHTSNLPKTFMATEDDFLEYLHSWNCSETRPKNLCRYLADKYLLVIGSEYPNWLFRFFWHSIKNFSITSSLFGNTQGIVTLDDSIDDYPLQRFLTRVQTQVFRNSSLFINELARRWSKECKSQHLTIGNRIPSIDIDFFISYASENYDIAEKIANTLINMGATVWFDKQCLEVGDEYDRIIEKNIQKCKRFVPLISKETLQIERRYFRKEWSLALEEVQYRLNMDFLLPILIDDCDITSDIIPKLFTKSQFLQYGSDSFEGNLKTAIRKLRQ